jgi:hypothetical protein
MTLREAAPPQYDKTVWGPLLKSLEKLSSSQKMTKVIARSCGGAYVGNQSRKTSST